MLPVVGRLVVVFLQQAGQHFDRRPALGGMFELAPGRNQVRIARRYRTATGFTHVSSSRSMANLRLFRALTGGRAQFGAKA